MQFKPTLLAAALLAAGVAAYAAASTGDTAPPSAVKPAVVLPPDARVADATVGQWTARWWQWVMSQPVEPYLDPDGQWCEMGQDGPVWFLAGTDGTFTAKRRCAVPEGKYVLVPIINMFHAYPHTHEEHADHTHECSVLQARAAVNNDHLGSAVVLVDGKPVGDATRLRVRSDGCFPVDRTTPDSRLAASDGYWLMLEPLSPGRHTLTIGANYGAPEDSGYGDMAQNFEYILDVGGHTDLASR